MRYRFRVGSPQKYDVVLLQAHLSPFLKQTLLGLRVLHLDLEGRVIFLNFRFIIRLIQNVRRVSRLAAWVAAVAESAGAKVVIGMDNFDTNVHNPIPNGETLFGELGSILKGAQMYSVQHGQELRRLERTLPLKNVTLLCWGSWVRDNYPRFGRREARYIPVGPLSLSFYLKMRPEKISKDVVVSLISTVKGPSWWGPNRGVRERAFEGLTSYFATFTAKHGLQPSVALTTDRDARNEGELEKEYFRSRLGSGVSFSDPTLLLGTSDVAAEFRRRPSHMKERYATYYLSDRSLVTVGMSSTVLWESFARGNRILAVNLTESDIFDFPIQGPWSLRTPTYDEFEAQLLNLINLQDSEWCESSKGARQRLIHEVPGESACTLIHQAVRAGCSVPLR